MGRFAAPLMIILALVLVGTPPTAQSQDDEGKSTYTIKHESQEMGQVTEDKALVYVLRPAFGGFAIKMWAFADDQFLGVTNGRNYIFALVVPGEHVFWSKAENVNAFKLVVEAGETYYLQQKVRMGGFRARVKFSEADESKVQKFLKKSKYVTPTDSARAKAQEYIDKWFRVARERAEQD